VSATTGMIAKATIAAVFGKPQRIMSKVIGGCPKCVQAQVERHP
jgi:hypothetical protein